MKSVPWQEMDVGQVEKVEYHIIFQLNIAA